nr:hypothetical protein [Angustibacter aerolatus]
MLDAMRVHPQAEPVGAAGRRARHGAAARPVDGPAGSDRRHEPSRWTSLRPGRDDEEPEPGLLGDVVLCPTVAERQAAEAGHTTTEEPAAAHDPRHPAPARVRPRRTRRGARDVRACSAGCC